jgi:oxygen-independent coproporphyrinogen III oxidase
MMLSDELLRELDKPGPRYTSYPTADRFSDSFGPADYARALAARAAAVAAGNTRPLSLYVHLPFCESVCYFCACNKIVTRQHGRVAGYLQALARELDLHRAALGPGQSLSQLHLGGGSPTFLNDDELAQLLAMIDARFAINADAEVAIEVDPRTVGRERLRRLVAMGFKRISFGVQDLDPDVQQAVHRIQPLHLVQALLEEARALGIRSVNVDLIYGLPRQTPETFAHTMAQVAALRPERIALYAYAHLPTRFKPQRRIIQSDLPDACARVRMLGQAIQTLTQAGYVYVGMDHFALPDDELAKAKAAGRMQRNFQGYSTQPEADLIAIGVSAIARVGNTYSQNTKDLPAYEAAMQEGRFAVERGVALSADDLLRRDIIMALMCQGRVDIKAIERAHEVDMAQAFAAELRTLQTLGQQGLVRLDDEAITVTHTGWYLVRKLASVFNPMLQAPPRADVHSRMG